MLRTATVCMSNALRETLVGVALAAKDARAPWWVISSAAAALHGAAPLDVADVDLLMGEEDARELVASGSGTVCSGEPSDRFRSRFFGRLTGLPLVVEVMAEFYVRGPERWDRVWPSTRVCLLVDDSKIYVPDRVELVAILELFGRSKDLHRAELLRQSA